MENNNNNTFAWQFIGCGSLVAFIVVAILLWNECKRSEQKTAANHELVRQGNELVEHMGVLQAENDSFSRANDSLNRVIVYYRSSPAVLDSMGIGVGFRITGTPITHSGKLSIDTTNKHYVGHDLPKH